MRDKKTPVVGIHGRKSEAAGAESISQVSAFTLRQGMQTCPGHPDKRASLSVKRTADGRWLLHCFAGCRTEEILAALGLTWQDLFEDRPTPQPHRRDDHPVDHQGGDRGLARALRQPWAKPGVLRRYRIADLARRLDHLAAGAARKAGALGPDDSATWDRLEAAATFTRMAEWVTSEL